MNHRIKIHQCYLCHILEGRKTFEIRKNDRDYQVGDTITFLPLEDENYKARSILNPIPDFEIVYVLSGFNGLQQNHVGLGIEPIKDGETDNAKKGEVKE